MKKVSTTFDAETVAEVEALVEDDAYPSRAAALRDLVEKGLRHDDVVERLEARHERERAELERDVAHLEARVDELTSQLQHQRERERDVAEVVEYVEEEKSLQERRERANVLERAKWWLFGRDPEEEG